jgi:SAM-dependent methyltransferase
MQKEIYNQFYKKYGKSIHFDPERFIAISNLAEGQVLDIACGTGDLADFYKGEYVGLDISDTAIDMARKTERNNARFYVSDVTISEEKFANKFDTIVMAEFLEHIEDDKIVFENIKKWTQPNARIVISVPNSNRVPDPNHLREFTIPQLRKRFSPMGKVKFYNWAGAKHRILMTIDLGQKNDEKLSLVMIAKNEEKGIERAILSAIEFTDNVVIAVDKSSEDQTLEIAKIYADTLKEFEWEDDFAKARNYAQKGVNTKWILSLDGHEFIKQCDQIDEVLEKNTQCIMVKMEMDAGDAFYTPRIYRSNIQWQYAIHNAIKCESMTKYTDFIIKHDRSGGQTQTSIKKRWEQRNQMMERLLKKELKENKESLRAIFYLARWYFTAGKLKKAIRYYEKYLKKGGPKGERWYCALEAAMAAIGLNKHLKALKFLRQAEKEVPNRWETVKSIGITYMLFERWKKAREFLIDSFKINTGDFAFYPMERNDADTWDLIGFCFYQTKDYEHAQVAWERSIELSEDEEQIKLNKKRIELIKRNIIL